MNNTLILSTFIKQLDECLDDISISYSEDKRFVRCKLYLDTIKKTNPRLLIQTWKTMITDKYEDQINAGNVEFFLEKDYTQEIPVYNPTIDNAIQDLRIAIKNMSDTNKAISIKYIQNLCKLSKLYV
jgi:Flp pilus assembly CpaF family ATPase